MMADSYYRARYYDPSTGRFISEDPTRFRSDINFYSYVQDNPINFVDPSGLLAKLYCEPIPWKKGANWKQKIGLLITQPKHCYLYVECHGFGAYLEIYGPAPNTDKGIPHNGNPFNAERAKNSEECKLKPPRGSGPCEFEDNLRRAFEMESSHLPNYDYTGPNSNTFANQLIEDAGGTADFPFNAYGWDWKPGTGGGKAF